MTKIWVALLAVLCAVSLALSLLWMVRPGRPAPQQAASAAPYLLKDHGGRLAVFAPGADEPLRVYEGYTHSLPAQDVAALQ